MTDLLEPVRGWQHRLIEYCVAGGILLGFLSIYAEEVAPLAMVLLAVGFGGVIFYGYSLLREIWG